MKIGKETVHVSVNGEVIETRHLNRGYPRALVYVENKDIATELSQGKPAQQAIAEALARKAEFLLSEAMKSIKELAKLDEDFAHYLICNIYENLPFLFESDGDTKRESLARRYAALYFALTDAKYSLVDKDDEYAELLGLICDELEKHEDLYNIDSECSKVNAAVSMLKEIQAQTATETQRPLTPKGRELFDAMQAFEKSMPSLSEEEWERQSKELDAAFDAIALKDPEEATRINRRSNYDIEYLGKYEVRLSTYTRCDRVTLKKLDTPEKREAYLACLHGDPDHPVPIRGTTDMMAIWNDEPTILKAKSWAFLNA